MVLLSWFEMANFACMTLFRPGDWTPTTASLAMRSAVQCHLRSQGCDGWGSSIALGATWATGSGPLGEPGWNCIEWIEIEYIKSSERSRKIKNQCFRHKLRHKLQSRPFVCSYITSTNLKIRLRVCQFMVGRGVFSHCKVLVLKEVLQPSEVQQPLGFKQWWRWNMAGLKKCSRRLEVSKSFRQVVRRGQEAKKTQEMFIELNTQTSQRPHHHPSPHYVLYVTPIYNLRSKSTLANNG